MGSPSVPITFMALSMPKMIIGNPCLASGPSPVRQRTPLTSRAVEGLHPFRVGQIPALDNLTGGAPAEETPPASLRAPPLHEPNQPPAAVDERDHDFPHLPVDRPPGRRVVWRRLEGRLVAVEHGVIMPDGQFESSQAIVKRR
jgi:hypothetical protein